MQIQMHQAPRQYLYESPYPSLILLTWAEAKKYTTNQIYILNYPLFGMLCICFAGNKVNSWVTMQYAVSRRNDPLSENKLLRALAPRPYLQTEHLVFLLAYPVIAPNLIQ